MPEQLLNSFLGIPSAKELPAAGILKTTSNSLQSNQDRKGENSFLAKLAYSMNNTYTIDDQNSTIIPSELNNISSIEEINHLIDMASMGATTNIATNIHGNQMLLNQVLNHDTQIETFIDGIVNNNTNNGKASPAQTQVFLDHALPNKQGLSVFNVPNINSTSITQEIASGRLPGLPSASSTDKSNTNEQNTTSILNKLNHVKIADTTGEEPLSLSSTISGKQVVESHKIPNINLNNQNDTKINNQNAAGILNKLNPAKIAGATGEKPLSQSSTIPAKQIAESYKGSNTNQNNTNTDEQNTAGILNKLNPAKIAGATGEEPLTQSSTIPDKQITEPYKGSNTNYSNQNNTKINNQNTANNENKLDNAPTIGKTSSDLTFQVSSTSNSGTNSLPQYNSKLAQTDSNESLKILDTSHDSAGATVSKSPDNTASVNNYGVNSVNADEPVLQLNTSSDNSSFNNQGTDNHNEFYINAVSASQKAEPGKNFSGTLSQINDSTKPFESLGSDTADNIVQKAKLFMEGGRSEIKLQLNPPELGILKLEFDIDGDNLDAKITVERSAVKDVIERDIPRLRELISNADIDVGKLDVSLQEKEDEKFSLMDKDLQSGSESNSAKDLPDHDNEFIEDGIGEESIEYDEDSNKINYLV